MPIAVNHIHQMELVARSSTAIIVRRIHAAMATGTAMMTANAMRGSHVVLTTVIVGIAMSGFWQQIAASILIVVRLQR